MQFVALAGKGRLGRAMERHVRPIDAFPFLVAGGHETDLSGYRAPRRS
ncbi:hypothetical protein B4113_2220 [Geobacillus sp. B4113_201601]|nr:hypothetical protein B4113_2220 [Geobacillus sp. B4113_201601]